MIFVDTNVFMYAVGKPHRLKSQARDFFHESLLNSEPLCTSAEVLQELMHVYLSVRKADVFEDAVALMGRVDVEVWPLEQADVALAGQLHDRYPTLSARDLCHLASCRRRNVREIKTFDRALASVFGSSSVS